MSIIYLWDGGSNTSPYDDWTKAATTYATAAGYWTAGTDVIYMAQDHLEVATSQLLNEASGDSETVRMPIYSMERSGTTYAPQTAIANFRASATTLTIADYLSAYGVYFGTSDDNITLSTPVGGYYKDCKFHISLGDGPKIIYIGSDKIFDSCTFSGSNYVISSGDNNLYLNCTFLLGGSATRQILLGPGNVVIGGQLGALDTAIQYGGRLIHTSVGQTAGLRWSTQIARWDHADWFACDKVGASEGRDWWTQRETVGGLCFPTTAVYRNAGWQDSPSETNLAWKMSCDSSSNTLYGLWCFSPPISSRIEETGTITFTAYGVHDSYTVAPTVDEVVMNVFYLGTADSTQWSLASTEDPTSTASLTSDTSDWTGASGKTKFKLSKTVTMNNTGEWMVQFLVKKYEAATFTWIDPKVEIT